MGEVLPITYWHSDSVISYLPALDVEPINGWRTQCDAERTATLARTDRSECLGGSRRITSNTGASFKFTSYGSSARLYGSVRDANFTVHVDDRAVSSSSVALNASAGILAELDGMTPGKHVVEVTVDKVEPNGQLDFNRVMFDVGQSSDRQNSTQNVGPVSAGWRFRNVTELEMFFHDETGAKTSRSQKSMVATRAGASAVFNFTGTTVFIFGNLIDDHGRYQVKLNDDDPSTFIGKSNYSFYEGLIFFAAGLDAVTEHTLTFTNVDNLNFDLVTAVVRSDPTPGVASSVSSGSGHEPTTSNSINRGGVKLAPIVGGAVGGTLTICAIVLLVLVLTLRRRRQQRHPPFQGTPTTEITGFIPPRFFQEDSNVESTTASGLGRPLHPPKRAMAAPPKQAYPPPYSG